MNTTIVLIPVKDDNSRKICELIENMKFNKYMELRGFIGSQLNEGDLEDVLFYSLSDFMDECNDQVIDLDNYFISYVQSATKINRPLTK